MTNKNIMMMYRIENDIPEDVELYTFGVWKNKGFMVKKGEKCKHRVPMWNYSEKIVTDEQGEEKKSGRCYGKTMHLFTREQVEPIQN